LKQLQLDSTISYVNEREVSFTNSSVHTEDASPTSNPTPLFTINSKTEQDIELYSGSLVKASTFDFKKKSNKFLSNKKSNLKVPIDATTKFTPSIKKYSRIKKKSKSKRRLKVNSPLLKTPSPYSIDK
jgi:antitoxin component YwqK of YwqJK toxin-antitoxin module